MLKKLIPILLILFFGGAGVAAGLLLKPEEAVGLAEGPPCGDDPNAKVADGPADTSSTNSETGEPAVFEYVKLNNQFIIPVIEGDVVRSVAIVALSLEVQIGTKDQVYLVEPKLRDVFLQALFDHASLGGFDGDFATSENLLRMRKSLKGSASKVLGSVVNDVLVTDIARQDN